jgi:hypothetical protein
MDERITIPPEEAGQMTRERRQFYSSTCKLRSESADTIRARFRTGPLESPSRGDLLF